MSETAVLLLLLGLALWTWIVYSEGVYQGKHTRNKEAHNDHA